jgi:outer membrane protein assembly factor BamE
MHIFLRLFTFVVAISLVGCGSAIPTIKPFKIDIQQGNVLTSEMLLKLRPGMNKSQVRFILGTPLLVDSFHSNRWDYFYQLRKQGEIVNQRRVILDFEDDLLVRVRGDVVPKGQTAEDVKKQLEAESASKLVPEGGKTEAVDANAPVIEPLEKPDIEAVDSVKSRSTDDSEELGTASEESSETKAEEAPASILAVPVPVVPAVTPQPAETIKTEPSVEESESSTVSAEPQEGNQQNKTKLVTPVAEPVISETQPVTEVVRPRSIGDGKKKVFIMDNQLDTSRVQERQADQVEPETTNSVAQELKENNEDVIEDEPDFFERMLEKIGF